MSSQIRELRDILTPGDALPSTEWKLSAILSNECLSYIAWNEQTEEALAIDPKREDWDSYKTVIQSLKSYRWIAVIDTHTHADHISIAGKLAAELKTPLIMHANAPSKQPQLRVSGQSPTTLNTQAGPLHFIFSPGHTQDSITVIWGPFIFGGDTILYGDTGRDDLPGGDAESHFESLQAIKEMANPEMIFLPGHDNKGGRASSWATQLKVNSSLTQSRADFVREASAFEASAPKLLKESLRENFK